MIAGCSSKGGIESCHISANMQFPTSKTKSAEYSLDCERRYATAQKVSSDASAKT